MRPLALAVLLAWPILHATTTVTVTGTTPTQAVIRTVTNTGAANCTHVIAEDAGLTILAHDVDTALFAGSNSDSRPGSVVNGPEHIFVAGTRTAAPAASGLFESRALSANTHYFGSVTCGADTVLYQFTTANIPMGNSFVEPLPFDSRGLGNYALPTIDFSNPAKFYIDPQSGFKYKLATGPGQDAHKSSLFTSGTGNGQILGTTSGTNWVNPANGLAVDTAVASYTVAGQDILKLRLPGPCIADGCFSGNWQGSINSSRAVDTYQAALTGNGGGSTVQVDVALSWNGVTQGSEWKTVTLPASAGTAVLWPAALSGSGLTAWQGPMFPLIPSMLMQAVQQNVQVNTSGSTVTWAGDSSQNQAYFPLDARILTAGSKITIISTEYTIASVDSATQITLTTSAGTHTGVQAYWYNLALWVRRTSAISGTVNIDGWTLTTAYSETFLNNRSGFQQSCSHLTSTDGSGKVGRFCLFPTTAGGGAVYWVTNDLDSRFISRAFIKPSATGVPAVGDEYGSREYQVVNIFDTTDPNSWWAAVTLQAAPGHSTLVKMTYTPAGVGGCGQTANYQALPLNPSYDSDSGIGDNCNIAVTELTRPTLGLGLFSQVNAIQPTVFSGKFSEPTLAFVQNGYAVMNANAGRTVGNPAGVQDSEEWIVTVNLSSGLVKGVYSSYMNQGNGSCRGCVIHGSGPSVPTDDWYSLDFNDYYYSGDLYQVTVQTALASTPSTTPGSACVVDASVAWMKPYSDGCDTVVLAGSDNIPCTPNPRTWDVTNSPNCTWHAGGWKQWEAGVVRVGDWVEDLGVGHDDKSVFAKSLGGTTWTLLRHVNVPQGATMVPRNDISPAAHLANWAAMIDCSYRFNAFIPISTETNGTGMLWDRRFISFDHNVFRNGGSSGGIIAADFYNGIGGGTSIRIGNYPGALNQPETNRVFGNAPFSGKNGAGAIQSHPAWDGVNPWFTDMSPYAGSAGGNFGLWSQVTTVAPSGAPLYRIAQSDAQIAPDKRRRAIVAWAGMNNFRDVSGQGVGATPFVTGQTLSTLGNSFTGSAGFKFTIGGSDISVTGVGRWKVTGNSQTHVTKIWRASDSVLIATATVDVAPGTAGQYAYTALGSPVTLTAGTTYILATHEVSGGDQSYDCTPSLTTTMAATVGTALYSNTDTPPFTEIGTPGKSCGLVNFQYTGAVGAITNSSSDNFKFCSIDYPGATCGQAGEGIGDVYINVPQASIDGTTGGAYDFNRPTVTTIQQEAMAALQYEFDHLGVGNLQNQGRWERRITTGGGRYGGMDTYSNAKVIWNSNILLFNCSTPNLQRAQDLCIGYLPPIPPVDSHNRSGFIPLTAQIGGGKAGDTMRIKWGYAENGPPSNFFCTSRQETCWSTSAPTQTVPYLWAGESQSPTPCGTSGCTVQVPALQERVLYYSVCRTPSGGPEKCDPMRVTSTP